MTLFKIEPKKRVDSICQFAILYKSVIYFWVPIPVAQVKINAVTRESLTPP